MLNSRTIITGLLNVEIWFFDPGEVQSRNHDLSVKLQAIPPD
jgi:hypothetical protein